MHFRRGITGGHGRSHMHRYVVTEELLAHGAPVAAHWIADPRFRDAVAHFLAEERGGMEAYLDELSERLPFKGT